jgi:hypothetical protein
MAKKPTTTFVLTGPRKGFSGVLGGRYKFENGEFVCNEEVKDKIKLVLCSVYRCNIKGDKPLWETKDGASVKVGELDKPKAPESTVVEPPKAEVKASASK